MYSKALIALAAAGLVGETLAAGHHRHRLLHNHQKKAVFTDVVTIVDWVTVTVTDGETSTAAPVFVTEGKHPEIPLTRSTSSTSASSTSSSTSSSTPSSTSSSVVPTTIVTQVKPSSTSSAAPNTPPAAVAVAVQSSSSSAAPAAVSVAVNPPAVVPAVASSSVKLAAAPAPSTHAAAPASTPASTGGSSGAVSTGKRGLPYNDGSLLSRFLGAGSKVSWAYNWGQTDDSGVALEFVPMLWGLKDGFPDSWSANAQKAISAGSKCLLSFNEPDLGSQSDMTPAAAAQQHIAHMNPFSGKARIGSPAITNAVGNGVGINWMQQFFDACAGQCAVDFIAIHIYGVDTNTFLSHALDVYNAFKKPVWITEFAFSGSDDSIKSQLETVIDQIETNSTFSFIERFSYFMAADGSLVQGSGLSSYGNTFAYGA